MSPGDDSDYVIGERYEFMSASFSVYSSHPDGFAEATVTRVGLHDLTLAELVIDGVKLERPWIVSRAAIDRAIRIV